MSGLHSPKLELPTKLLSGSLISWRFSCSKILTFSMVDLPIQHFSFYFILLVKLYKSKCCPLNSDVFVPVKNTCCYLDPTFWPLNFIISFASSSSTVDSSKHQKGKPNSSHLYHWIKCHAECIFLLRCSESRHLAPEVSCRPDALICFAPALKGPRKQIGSLGALGQIDGQLENHRVMV